MENKTEQYKLQQIYNVVDWLDLGLVVAIILYYVRLVNRLQYNFLATETLDYSKIINLIRENTNLTGIVLLVASLIICVVFICLTIKMRKTRQIGVVRTTARLIWNGIWIPFDLYFLVMVLFF